jgi:uncharacterized damage-inducible protein DinB
MAETEVDEHGRPEPPHAGDEVATLLGFLDYQRGTLAWKCAGLSDEQLRQTLPPSSMSLGGMLKHLAYVEDYWFTEGVGEQPSPEPWASVDWKADRDWEWHSAAVDTGEALRGLWDARVQAARDLVAAELSEHGSDALGRTHPAWDGRGQVSLRWVLTHMIEEYARHNGHADFLRESIDGATGE